MVNAFFCPLTHEGVLAIEGVDSKKFLQGQVTCNLNYLTPELSSLGARCTPKGRMTASFRVIERAADHYLLSLDSRLVSTQHDDFKKYAIFSKVSFTAVTDRWLRFGLQGMADELAFLKVSLPTTINQISHQADYFIIKVSEHRFELWVATDSTTDIVKQLADQLPQQTLNAWLLGQIQAGIGQVFKETTELFIPQMINLQAVGGVSFKKGCYTGQEIVARMQYLGKLKRHLYRFKLASSELPSKGWPLFSPVHNSSVGEVVLAAFTTPNEIELLAVVLDEATETKLWLKDGEGQLLERLELPYQLNSEEEIKR